MRALVVTAHPDEGSLTHHAAALVRDALGPDRTDVAHLAQEGFDPRFTPSDRRAYVERTPPEGAVRAEQERIDGHDHLVLVFPVWWWSAPALLKGWIDRVFVAGWAFTYGEDDRVVGALDRLTVHVLALSGSDRASFARHGYADAFATQVLHGVVDFCGARRGAVAFAHDADSRDRDAVAAELGAAVEEVRAAVAASRPGA